MANPDTTPRVWVALTAFDGTAVLTGLRGEANNSNTWNLFGGKVDLGESFPEAIARELTEETGLDLTVKPKHQVFSTLYRGKVCVWFEKKLKTDHRAGLTFTKETADYDFANESWLTRTDLHYSLRMYLEYKYLGRYRV